MYPVEKLPTNFQIYFHITLLLQEEAFNELEITRSRCFLPTSRTAKNFNSKSATVMLVAFHNPGLGHCLNKKIPTNLSFLPDNDHYRPSDYIFLYLMRHSIWKDLLSNYAQFHLLAQENMSCKININHVIQNSFKVQGFYLPSL